MRLYTLKKKGMQVVDALTTDDKDEEVAKDETKTGEGKEAGNPAETTQTTKPLDVVPKAPTGPNDLYE